MTDLQSKFVSLISKGWVSWAGAVAAAVVIAAYVFFATAGTLGFDFLYGPDEYQSLAIAYLHGQLHLQEQPDPRLAELANPYDRDQRGSIPYHWDASYYNGRYYLYFSPVPVLTVYLPWHVVTGEFPEPALVLALFAALAWVFQVTALFVAAPEYLCGSGRRAALVLLLGLANLVPYTLLRPDVYELAVMSGYACSSAFLCCASWIWFRRPAPTVALLAGLTCGLSFASRASLAPLLLLLGALAVVIWRRYPSPRRWSALAGLSVPVVLIAGAMAWYNAARFGSALEFGTSFMLNSSQREYPMCSPLTPLGWERALNAAVQYAVSIPKLDGVFPFIRLRPGVPPVTDALDARFSLEEVAGLVLLFPLLPLGLAALPWTARARVERRMTAFAAVVVLCGAAIAFTVGSCVALVLRYQLDFWPAFAVAAGLGMCRLLAVVQRRWQRAAVAGAAAWSLVSAVLLGMSGNGDLLRARNPELFERFVSALSPTVLLEFPRRVGCYRWPFRDVDRRDHGVVLTTDPWAPPEVCLRVCREVGARYAAALEPGQCTCSAVLGHSGLSRTLVAEPGITGRSLDFCQRPCATFPWMTCGTEGYSAVFMLRP